MASWLVHLTMDGVVLVQALARDTVLCSWARHFSLTVPLSQMFKWIPANLMLRKLEFSAGGMGLLAYVQTLPLLLREKA